MTYNIRFRYIFGSVGQDDLVAFYRYADVALVTPLRDGMNLVAKEFVACQDDNDPGVLILSPFAGAGGKNFSIKRLDFTFITTCIFCKYVKCKDFFTICNHYTIEK